MQHTSIIQNRHLRLPVACLATILGLTSYHASAALITSAEAVAAVPTTSGNGLNGQFFKRSVSNSTEARSAVATYGPDVTFHSTSLDYPRGNTNDITNSTLLSTYLADDATNVTSGSAGSFNVDLSIFRFNGFIAIRPEMDTNTLTPEIDVLFTLGSDDGGYIKIGNTVVAEYANSRGFNFTDGVASFQSAGLYAFETLYFERGGNTGIEVFSSIGPTATRTDAPNSNMPGIIPASALYTAVPLIQAPEPTSLLPIIGAMLIGMSARLRASRE